jgi:hypothetical protein
LAICAILDARLNNQTRVRGKASSDVQEREHARYVGSTQKRQIGELRSQEDDESILEIKSPILLERLFR